MKTNVDTREDVAANCGVAVEHVPVNYVDLTDEEIVEAVQASLEKYKRTTSSLLWQVFGKKR